MTAPFTGGCLCGAVRYEVSTEPRAFMSCHCRDCQYASGGGPGRVLAVERAGFKFTQGEDAVATYESVADSGNQVYRSFCFKCGTPLLARNSGNPDFMGVKVGTLDDPSWPETTMAIWTGSAPPWDPIEPGVPTLERGIPG